MKDYGCFRMTTYYEILEVSREAVLEEIRTAYRRLAIRYHPDKNPGDKEAEDRFKQISEAYQVLADEEKRQLYDLYGDAGLAGLELGGFNGFEDIFSSFGEAFEDFFRFGQSRDRQDQPQPGADLRQPVVLTLEEVARGLDTSLVVERRVSCPRCQGEGAEPGCPRQTCPTCEGQGQVSQSKGIMKVFNTCPDCQGSGSHHHFSLLRLSGRRSHQRKKAAAGAHPPRGGYGHPPAPPGRRGSRDPGGATGDLYLEICVAPHDIFTRKRQDLYYRAPISFVEAALGTEVEVPTLKASTRLTIPPGNPARGHLAHSRPGFARLTGQSPGGPGGGRGPPNPHPTLGSSEATPQGIPQPLDNRRWDGVTGREPEGK